MFKTVLVPILLIALTDVALQLDNAIAISSVASGVPASQRLPVLALGVLVAAGCLIVFTLVGSQLVERLTWLKPLAGLALFVIGGQLILAWARS